MIVSDMPNFRADRVENAVWEYAKEVLLHPDHLASGFQAGEMRETGKRKVYLAVYALWRTDRESTKPNLQIT
jgi:hypothetical protein